MGRYDFAVDTVTIHTTRSFRKDTDYISASVAVAGRPPTKATQRLGSLGKGTHRTTIMLKDVQVADGETAVFTYAVINSGHKDPGAVEKGLQQTVAHLAEKGASIAAKATGHAIGTALGASIGTAAVPIAGTAIGAVAGWLVSKAGSALFANCDGPVAAGVHAYTGKQLQAGAGHGKPMKGTDHQPGTDSPSGCGRNSKYDIAWSIAAM